MFKKEKSPIFLIVLIQSLSLVRLFMTPQTAACQASLPFTITWNLFKFIFTEMLIVREASCFSLQRDTMTVIFKLFGLIIALSF